MARQAGGARSAAQDDHFDIRALTRLGTWGGAAAFALLIAVLAARSEIGSRRLVYAYASIVAPPGATGSATAARSPENDPEVRQLAETVRALTFDRDRLLTRLAALEHNLDDVTGSIQAAAPLANAAATGLPVGGPSVVNTISAAAVPTPRPDENALSKLAPGSRVATAHAVALGEAPPADSIVTRTEFGADIGGGPSVEALRALWLTARSAHAPLLHALQPVVAVRDRGKAGAVELRLVVGPLANAAAAARLCAGLSAAGVPCKPTIFDGQRLALR
jgi:hypothetical protein